MRVYRGTPGTPGDVVVFDGPPGACGTPLRHHVRHSPTGFSWGYGGSGPADLARCLLIDALGDDAMCKVCGGNGHVVYDDELRDFRPLRGPDDWREANEKSAQWGDADAVVGCFDCDSGIARGLPYQAFKFEVVARWPMHEAFETTDLDIRRWYELHTQAVAS